MDVLPDARPEVATLLIITTATEVQLDAQVLLEIQPIIIIATAAQQVTRQVLTTQDITITATEVLRGVQVLLEIQPIIIIVTAAQPVVRPEAEILFTTITGTVVSKVQPQFGN